MKFTTKYFSRLFLFLICWSTLSLSCISKSEKTTKANFDIQGHRGCRGLMPENSAEGFIKALDLGVTTLEMDVVVSKDQKVIVSHEPYLSPNICLDLNGDSLSLSPEELNMYQMTYDQIRQFDCGSLGNVKFPKQSKSHAIKPLLSEVFNKCEEHVRQYKKALPYYNIEIKSHSQYDNQFHPEPAKYCELVISEIKKEKLEERVIIQSFDVRPLRYIAENYPDIRLAYLVENQLSHLHNLQKLGFELDIYSPQYEYVSEKMVNDLHERNIAIIPWTVNSKEEMKRQISMDVDGLISDYPDILLSVVDSLGLER